MQWGHHNPTLMPDLRLASSFIALAAIASSSAAQSAGEANPGDQLARATAQSPVARWLTIYDKVAWVTTDSLRTLPKEVHAQLGPEWLCDTMGGVWHAFYGRYDSTTSRYSIAAHYERGETGFFLSTTPIDTARIQAGAAAIFNTRRRVPASFQPRGLSLNTFVRFVTRDSIDVWMLPAFQPSGIIVYGTEARYRWDATGQVLVDSTLVNNGLRWARPDTSATLVMQDSTVDAPTAVELYYLMNYSSYFKKLAVRTREFYTTYYRTPEGPIFVTIPRDSTWGQPEKR